MSTDGHRWRFVPVRPASAMVGGALSLLLGSLLLLLPNPAAAQEGDAAAREDGSTPSEIGRVSRIWWNQERYVEKLALSEEQREAMDRELVEHLRRRRELAAEMTEKRRELGGRLAVGDWEGSEVAATAVASAQAAFGRCEAELAIAVTKLLSDAQRRTVAAEFPRLLDRPMLVGGVGGRFRGMVRTDRGAAVAPGPRAPSGGRAQGSRR